MSSESIFVDVETVPGVLLQLEEDLFLTMLKVPVEEEEDIPEGDQVSPETDEMEEPQAKKAKFSSKAVSSPASQDQGCSSASSISTILQDNPLPENVSSAASSQQILEAEEAVRNEIKRQKQMIISQEMILEENQKLRNLLKDGKHDCSGHEAEIPPDMQAMLQEKNLEIQKLRQDHEKEMGKLMIRLDEIRVAKMDAERQAKADRKSLDEVRQQKISEIKVLREEYEDRANETKKAHQREVLAYRKQVSQLQGENEHLLTTETSLRKEITRSQARIHEQGNRIKDLEARPSIRYNLQPGNGSGQRRVPGGHGQEQRQPIYCQSGGSNRPPNPNTCRAPQASRKPCNPRN